MLFKELSAGDTIDFPNKKKLVKIVATKHWQTSTDIIYIINTIITDEKGERKCEFWGWQDREFTI